VEIDLRLVVNLEHDAASHRALEATGHSDDLVTAHRKIGCRIEAEFVGVGVMNAIGLELCDSDGRASYGGI